MGETSNDMINIALQKNISGNAKVNSKNIQEWIQMKRMFVLVYYERTEDVEVSKWTTCKSKKITSIPSSFIFIIRQDRLQFLF